MSASSATASAQTTQQQQQPDEFNNNNNMLDEALAVTWARPPVSYESGMPAARGGHTANMVGNLMIVAFGTFYDAGKFNYLSDIWALDTDRMKWHKPIVAGKAAPGPRYGHSSIVVDDTKLYIFGGRGENGLMYNDLWVLDVEKWSWELLPSTSAPPSPRMGHNMVSVAGKLVVGFGWDSKLETYNDVWVYSREAFSWNKPKQQGAIPPPRYGAGCVYDERNGRLVLFGGSTYDEKGHPINYKDTRELDLRSMMWSRSRVGGEYPSARYSHGCSLIGNVMICFGGWHGPEKEKSDSSTSTHGAGSSAAASSSTTASSSAAASTNTIIIPHKPGMGYGSEAPADSLIKVPFTAHDSTYFLDLETLEWIQPQIAGTPPGYRYGATIASSGVKAFAFGGWENGRALSEVLVLDLEAIVA